MHGNHLPHTYTYIRICVYICIYVYIQTHTHIYMWYSRMSDNTLWLLQDSRVGLNNQIMLFAVLKISLQLDKLLWTPSTGAGITNYVTGVLSVY